MRMTQVLESEWLRLIAYGAAAIACLAAGWSEQQSNDDDPATRWPSFWFVATAIFMVMGLARATDLTDVITNFGRDRAEASGW